MAERQFVLDNTDFVYRTNLAGDPSRDGYGSDQRNCNIVIDEATANELVALGVEVKQTKPTEDYPDVQIFVKAIAKYENSKFPPKIYLVNGTGEDVVPELLAPENLYRIDELGSSVYKVQAVIQPYYLERYRRWCVYIQTMYVFATGVADDPFASNFNWDRE